MRTHNAILGCIVGRNGALVQMTSPILRAPVVVVPLVHDEPMEVAEPVVAVLLAEVTRPHVVVGPAVLVKP